MTRTRDRVEKLEKRTERPNRVKIGGFRDVLTVHGLDEDNFAFRWVLDRGGRGDRVAKMKLNGWEPQLMEEGIFVGDARVGVPTPEGTLITVSAGGGSDDKLVLMRLKKEWWEEDQRTKAEEVDALEESMRQDFGDGRYGSISFPKD
jgi:hypothetical protein